MILNDTSNTFVWFSNVLCIHISKNANGIFVGPQKNNNGIQNNIKAKNS